MLLPLNLLTVSPDQCGGAMLLPAYSHNDYRNPRPLFDALLLGYRGVEADVFLLNGDIVVAHDRREARQHRTLEQLYLAPLRDRLRACGYLLHGGAPFFLNIELKERDPEAFRVLVDRLKNYDDLFRPSAPGLAAPARLTLVGWWPPLLTGPDYLRVQLIVEKPGSEAADGSIGLVSVDYSKALKWNGRGEIAAAAMTALATARKSASALGVPLRVHQVPNEAAIYRWLLSNGVTLIGVKDLARGRDLLTNIESIWRDH